MSMPLSRPLSKAELKAEVVAQLDALAGPHPLGHQAAYANRYVYTLACGTRSEIMFEKGDRSPPNLWVRADLVDEAQLRRSRRSATIHAASVLAWIAARILGVVVACLCREISMLIPRPEPRPGSSVPQTAHSGEDLCDRPGLNSYDRTETLRYKINSDVDQR